MSLGHLFGMENLTKKGLRIGLLKKSIKLIILILI